MVFCATTVSIVSGAMAIAPDTIDTVVAQNTIWKYQSDPSEYPVSIAL